MMSATTVATDRGYDCLNGCGICLEMPAPPPREEMVRQLLTNMRIAYWIGGAGYDHHLLREEIEAVEIEGNRFTAHCRITGRGEDRIVRGYFR